MSDKDIFWLFFCSVFFGGPGAALLWYVYYCLKQGSVASASKFGGYRKDSRKEDPTSYWGMIFVYTALAVWLIYLAIKTTTAILQRNGYFG
jgi:hypothetical protein